MWVSTVSSVEPVKVHDAMSPDDHTPEDAPYVLGPSTPSPEVSAGAALREDADRQGGRPFLGVLAGMVFGPLAVLVGWLTRARRETMTGLRVGFGIAVAANLLRVALPTHPHPTTAPSGGRPTIVDAPRAPRSFTAVALRRRLQTRVALGADPTPAPDSPPEGFEKVWYRAPLGRNVAYVSARTQGPPRPAIVWLVGGFHWGVGEDDDAVAAFRAAGLVVMRPALRGADGNPGQNECFLGEADDVVAAAEYLAQRPDVDPARIYLGGHSTGGTLALLAAESTDRFRAVFAFGPNADPRRYGQDGCMPAGLSDEEVAPRVPALLIHEVVSPTFVIEGSEGGNVTSFPILRSRVRDAPVRFIEVPGVNHFSVLGPGAQVIARRIVADGGPSARIELDDRAIVAAAAAHR